MEKGYHANGNQKKVAIAILALGKVNLTASKIARHRDEYNECNRYNKI